MPTAVDSLGRIWRDKSLRQQLRQQPQRALAEFDVHLPADIAVRTVACKGSPADPEDASLLQFLLEKENRMSYFFTASPRSPCAQQAAYGRIIGRDLDDPVFAQRLRADAAAALRVLESD